MTKCSWCSKETKEAHYPNVRDFLLSFEEGTTSEDTGPNLVGYEVEDLCIDCAWKLKDELKKLGITVTKIDV